MFDSLSTPAGTAGGRPAPSVAAPQPPSRGFAAALAAEFRRLARAPREDLSILLFNAVLVCGCWFLLPRDARDWLFELHGPLAFAVVLESWMLADTPATNVLGNDAPAALAALPDRSRLRRLLRVKITALACVVGIVSAFASVLLGLITGRPVAGLATAVALLVLPFGTTAVSSWLGIVVPYHRRSLRQRWAHRRRWWETLRWIALVFLPYLVVPAVSGILLAPGAVVGVRTGARRLHHAHITGPGVLVGSLVASLLALVVYLLATRAGARLAARRARSLQAYLRDPERG